MSYTILKKGTGGPISFARHDVTSAIQKAKDLMHKGHVVSIRVPNGTIYTPDQFDLLQDLYDLKRE